MDAATGGRLQRISATLGSRQIQVRGHLIAHLLDRVFHIGECQRQLHQERPVVVDRQRQLRERAQELGIPCLSARPRRPVAGGILRRIGQRGQSAIELGHFRFELRKFLKCFPEEHAVFL